MRRALRPSVLLDAEDQAAGPASTSTAASAAAQLPADPTPAPGTGAPGDSLDLFMTGLAAQLKAEEEQHASRGVGAASRPEIVSDALEYDDYGEQTAAGAGGDGGEGASAEGDGGAGMPLLPQVDHSTVTYAVFQRNFYSQQQQQQHQGEDSEAAEELRQQLEVTIEGGDRVPPPVASFAALPLPPQLLREITKAGFTSPTPVQSQALPVALSGRDLVCLARTGSGKTLAFLWPMVVHVVAQPQMESGDGPIGLVLCPTRELAAQTLAESKRFAGAAFSIRSVCISGGGAGAWEMHCKLRDEAPEIVVATPGRLLDLLRRKATNLRRVTMLVLDEADKMIEMGFAEQTRAVVSNVRPDAQRMLFSATMSKSVARFVRDCCFPSSSSSSSSGDHGGAGVVRIVVGGTLSGAANPDVQQRVHVLEGGSSGGLAAARWAWLEAHADEMVEGEGKLLVFVNAKAETEALAAKLRGHFSSRRQSQMIGVAVLHGDKTKAERESALKAFTRVGGGGDGSSAGTATVSVLVATDLASRGLHVPGVRLTVVNYEMPLRIATYVHRIGRTGRLGQDSGGIGGVAHTLVARNTPRQLLDALVSTLAQSEQAVPEALQRLVGPGGVPALPPPAKKSRWD